jgi:hypothetical protein
MIELHYARHIVQYPKTKNKNKKTRKTKTKTPGKPEGMLEEVRKYSTVRKRIFMTRGVILFLGDGKGGAEPFDSAGIPGPQGESGGQGLFFSSAWNQ